MNQQSKQRTIKTFKAMRWVSIFSFLIIMLNMTQLANKNIFLIAALTFIVSFIYIIFWRCPACSKRFSSKAGFINITWPYVNKCLKCKTHLNDM